MKNIIEYDKIIKLNLRDADQMSGNSHPKNPLKCLNLQTALKIWNDCDWFYKQTFFRNIYREKVQFVNVGSW